MVCPSAYQLSACRAEPIRGRRHGTEKNIDKSVFKFETNREGRNTSYYLRSSFVEQRNPGNAKWKS